MNTETYYAVKIIKDADAAASSSKYATFNKISRKATSRGAEIARQAKLSKEKKQEAKAQSQRAQFTSISTLREIKLLKELQGPNIVELIDVILDQSSAGGRQLAIVFEFVSWDMRQIVDEHSRTKRPVPLYTVKSMVWQVLKALRYLHENWVMHRDIKPQNIFVVGSGPDYGRIKLGDFNLARVCRDPIRPLGKVDKTVVTLWYRAPELLLGATNYDCAVDVWSLGCVFADLCLAGVASSRRALFPGNEVRKGISSNVQELPEIGTPFEALQCHEIFSICGFPSFPGVDRLPGYQFIAGWKRSQSYPSHPLLREAIKHKELDDNAHCLLGAMLSLDPTKRITCDEALSSPFFRATPLPGDNSLLRKEEGKESLRYSVVPPRPMNGAMRKSLLKHGRSSASSLGDGNHKSTSSKRQRTLRR